MRHAPTASLLLSAFCLAGCAGTAAAQVRHVIVAGFDGLSPGGIQKSRTPQLDRLRHEGAWTFHARGVMPTTSSPNWASMIMGAGPEQHGVTSNDWQPDKFDIAPVATGPGGIFPTVFGVLRRQRPKARIAVFHDWADFARLLERGVPDVIRHTPGPAATLEAAVAAIRAAPPQLLFLHFDHVDHAGHQFGHGSPEYLAAVEEADRIMGRLVDALREKGIYDQTILLVTSDHGGVGKGHGGATMAEIEIPWIIRGPGVAGGREITVPVNTYDTAATLAYVLKLKPPDCWIARPVMAAFR